jgi:uncharacterized protein (TIGR03083 family)
VEKMVAYRAAHHVATSLLTELAPEQLDAQCPQCPGWTVQDVVCHHVHVFTACVDGGWTDEVDAIVNAAIVEPDPELKAAATRRRDDWIQRGVEALRSEPFDVVLARWDDALSRAADDDGDMVTDLAVHLGDIEEALGVQRSRAEGFNVAALWYYGSFLTDHLRGRGVETVRLHGSSPTVVCGDLRSPHVVTGSTYELLRTITGRRSRAEADRVIDWNTTPERTRLILPVYDWLEHDSTAVEFGGE